MTSDPQLTALALNSPGLTQTMALGTTSPAIDAGVCESTITSGDQRGISRPQGAACDIGAYELVLTVAVTIASAPTGRAFSVSGAGCQPGNYTTPQSLSWNSGASCSVSLTSTQSGNAGVQYVFSGWSDGGVTNPRTIAAPAAATTYTANFTTQYYLTTAASSGGSISPAGEWVNKGTSVSVSASANTGYLFTGFSGDLTSTTYPQSITMNAPHSVTANFGLITTTSVASASGQYSDPVTPSATITLAVSGSLQFAVGGVNVGGPVTVTGSGTYSAPSSYVITQAQRTYTGAITAVFSSSTTGILGSSGANDLVVSRENATVTPSSSNAMAVQVSTPGGTASSIMLAAAIQEVADGSLGDISKATPVTFTLIPVVAAPSIICPVTTSVAAGVLTATATCTNVPVNVYDVHTSIGGNYYTGSADSVVAVYDPSLGFVTGGGTILHNGVRANFGLNAKYLKSGQVQGGLLYIEHRATGDVILKSNALSSLSVVQNTAGLLGKATLGGVGNYTFQATVAGNAQPATNDQFGLQVKDPSGNGVPGLTFGPINLTGGIIQVPK